MKTTIISGFIAILALVPFASCKKEAGFGGKKIIKGAVTYNGGSPAAGAVIYLAFDKTEATTEFNYSTTADSSGNYRFEDVQIGNYYVDAVYVDANGFEFNTPGTTVTCEKKKGEVVVDFALE